MVTNADLVFADKKNACKFFSHWDNRDQDKYLGYLTIPEFNKKET